MKAHRAVRRAVPPLRRPGPLCPAGSGRAAGRRPPREPSPLGGTRPRSREGGRDPRLPGVRVV